jgi:2-hydroxy-6-oxonona-2,4-dienedioate hydrolase
MAAQRSGSGPDLVLFHGGMGSWKHWIRNVEPLARHFTVHALDHPSYGASAPVPRETTGAVYLDLVHELLLEMLPGERPLRFAGFSFGGAIATNLARRLGSRVTHLCLVSPGGFPTRRFGERPIRSYKEAGDDPQRFREICRHNLLVNMLSDPASVGEEAVDIQADGVRRTRFDSRKVSGGGTLLGDLAKLTCKRLAVPPRRSAHRRDPRGRRHARRAPDSPGRPLVGLRERAGGQSADAGVLRALTVATLLVECHGLSGISPTGPRP